MSEDKPTYSTSDVAQVTNYDRAAETLAAIRESLPKRLTTDLAYCAAVTLCADILTLIEGYEMAQALDRTAGGL